MSKAPRCTFDVEHGTTGETPCGRTMVGADPSWFCPVHDRVCCTAGVWDLRTGTPTRCGYRLIKGNEEMCPQCRLSVRLADVIKRQP